MKITSLKSHLDALYTRLNRRKFVSPDPLQFLYDYKDPAEREIVGLIASSLAYGRVTQILASVSNVLDRIRKPRKFVETSNGKKMEDAFLGFKHRFTTGDEMAALLQGARIAIKKHGSLGACFANGIKRDDDSILPALENFVAELNEGANGKAGSLLAEPSRGSACKRLHMYLRWMVRKDAVDPGGWNDVSPSKLIVPLDTHMYRICKELGMTERKSADSKTALEITNGFREISPKDPVRYDFSITRLGIRDDMDPLPFIRQCI